MRLKKILANLGVNAAKKSALTTAKSPSKNGYYQPAEPKELEKLLKQQQKRF